MCREMEQIISDLITELETPTDGQPAVPDLSYVIANEAGAADYSDSPVAREEFPNVDRMTRGTISIGRRLQDPLAELVKIDPQHVGVGLYQHDVKPKHLKESIDEVIESCVNEVGVDVNHAGRVAAAPCVRPQPGGRPGSRPVSRGERPVPPRPTAAGSEPWRGSVHPGGGVPEDPRTATIRSTPRGFTRRATRLARQLLAEAGFIDADLRDPEKLARIKAKLAEVNAADAAARFSTGRAVRDVIAALSDPFPTRAIAGRRRCSSGGCCGSKT